MALSVRPTRAGNFQKEFGIDVECYVLDDSEKTGVLSQTGMASVLGFAARGSSLPSFLKSRAMADAVGSELMEKIQNPLKFQYGSGGSGAPPIAVHGFDATLLIDLCKAITSAPGPAAPTAGA